MKNLQITIIASGSRGDVQPYVALGKGLKDAGHSVRIMAPTDFQYVTGYWFLEPPGGGDPLHGD